MIKSIIDILNYNEWYVGDEDIDFAKGSYKLPNTFKQTKQIIKRRSYGRK